MESKTAMMVGAAAALVAGPVLGAPPAVRAPSIPVATSYAELLQPIPDAVERLKLSDAEAAARPPELILAQWVDRNQHHHHHSNEWYRQNGYYWNGAAWALRPAPHHHHHSNEWYRQNGYYWNGNAWTPGPAPHHHHDGY